MNIQRQNHNSSNELSPILIKLLQGFIFQDDKKYWDKLIVSQESVRTYFSAIGLYLHLNIEEGYAFLKSTPAKLDNLEDRLNEQGQDFVESMAAGGDLHASESSGTSMSLVRKFPLSFDVSLLLVLLRESLEQFDVKVNDDYRLILSKNDIYDLLKLFYSDKNDELLLLKKFDATIGKVVEIGILKELKNNAENFEVRRVLKAFFDASKLQEMKEKMKSALRLNRVELQVET